MANENEAILRRWVEEVWNKGRLETIEDLFDRRGVLICPIYPSENPIIGIEGIEEHTRQVRRIFSDIHMTILEWSDDGKKVISFCRFEANRLHENDDGSISAKPVSIDGLCQIKVHYGKIYEAWTNFDLINAGL